MLGYVEFFDSLADKMDRIGGHLSYLSEFCHLPCDSDKIENVRMQYGLPTDKLSDVI